MNEPGPSSVIIVGGGLAGAKTAEALRTQGYAGPVTLVSSEHELPYERPPLSKGFLSGASPFEDAVVHPEQWYRDNDVRLVLGQTVIGIDRAAKTVTLSDVSEEEYGALVLATGSQPRTLPLPGVDAEGVLTLRTRADSEALKGRFGQGRSLVCIGGGWIGLEVAAAARNAGTVVSVVEAAPLPLAQILGSQVASVFADLHRAHGVDLRLGVKPTQVLTVHGRVSGVRLEDGTEIAADTVLLGIGAAPRTSLAEHAGLAVDGGVLVDAALRTSDPSIWAVGDIANAEHPVLGGRVRVEHWATALKQPATAAAAILGGTVAYDELPYFFSDQYDLGMEYVGHTDPSATVVVRGSLADREFVAFWLDGENRLMAAMNVNVWDVPDAVKPIIGSRRAVDPARLADPAVPLADL